VTSDYRFKNFVKELITSKNAAKANESGIYALLGSCRFRICILCEVDRKEPNLLVSNKLTDSHTDTQLYILVQNCNLDAWMAKHESTLQTLHIWNGTMFGDLD